MRGEPGTHQVAVEGPAVFGVGGGVHPDEPSPGSHLGLEGGLLGVVEDIAGRVEEDDHLVLAEVRRRESVGVLGGGDREAVGAAQITDGLDTNRNRVVPESGRLTEDQNVVGGIGRDRRAGGQQQG